MTRLSLFNHPLLLGFEQFERALEFALADETPGDQIPLRR